MSQNATIYIC